jgi:hypothetical protein
MVVQINDASILWIGAIIENVVIRKNFLYGDLLPSYDRATAESESEWAMELNTSAMKT